MLSWHICASARHLLLPGLHTLVVARCANPRRCVAQYVQYAFGTICFNVVPVAPVTSSSTDQASERLNYSLPHSGTSVFLQADSGAPANSIRSGSSTFGLLAALGLAAHVWELRSQFVTGGKLLQDCPNSSKPSLPLCGLSQHAALLRPNFTRQLAERDTLVLLSMCIAFRDLAC